MSKKEIDILVDYCYNNGWGEADLEGVIRDSIEDEDLAANASFNIKGIRHQLSFLLMHFETVDKVINLLPASGQDY